MRLLPTKVMHLYSKILIIAALVTAGLAAQGCRPPLAEPAVVVYCSLDEPYARPILDAYRKLTGGQVVPLYDTEATKSVGLAQRIRQERDRPRADVFWSSEAVRLIQLAHDGMLEPYASPSAEGIPPEFRDPESRWTGFAARARVLAVHQGRAYPPPASILELTAPRWKDEVAMANPRAGTTATEAAALFSVLGNERATRFYRGLKANGIRIVDGNAMSANWVAQGEVLAGLTDTDDVFSREDAGEPIEAAFPDEEGMGTLLIPNTAALVRGGPHPTEGRRFLDHLLRAETELALSRLPSRQIPLHPNVAAQAPEQVRKMMQLRRMRVDYNQLARLMPEVDSALRKIF